MHTINIVYAHEALLVLIVNVHIPLCLVNTVRVLNFVGKIFVFLVGNKIHGVLIFMAMAEW